MKKANEELRNERGFLIVHKYEKLGSIFNDQIFSM